MSAPAATIIEALDDSALLGAAFRGDSWSTWRAILKAAYALPMTAEEIEAFRAVAERDPPTRQVRELVIVAGRRGGKDSVASAIAAHAAAFRDYRALLRPGERAVISCLAVDRDQASVVLGYIKAYFAEGPLAALVEVAVADGIDLTTGASIQISTNSFRRVRGRTVACAIFDECAFWRDEGSASPDKETYRAILPSLSTIPGSMIVMITSPYKKAGLVYEKYRKHYGKNGDDVLVIAAPSIALNPTLDKRMIEEAMADDPAAARSEWLGQFRDDIAQAFDPDVVQNAIVAGRYELPPVPGMNCVGFTDAAGGSGGDSWTSAVAYLDRKSNRVVVAGMREKRPLFSPAVTCEEHAAFFRSYGVRRIFADRWGGQFPVETFRKHGIDCRPSERTKSDIYRETLPLLNSGRVELLDIPRLTSQILGLERRTWRGGKDSFDHPPGSGAAAHDDCANAVCGAIVLAAEAQKHFTKITSLVA